MLSFILHLIIVLHFRTISFKLSVHCAIGYRALNVWIGSYHYLIKLIINKHDEHVEGFNVTVIVIELAMCVTINERLYKIYTSIQ